MKFYTVMTDCSFAVVMEARSDQQKSRRVEHRNQNEVTAAG